MILLLPQEMSKYPPLSIIAAKALISESLETVQANERVGTVFLTVIINYYFFENHHKTFQSIKASA